MSEVGAGEGVGDWDFMDDQIHTPEHWSDVGAMRTRVSLLEQQLQLLQTQMSTVTGQLTHMASAMQQLDMQFTIQRQQQQEDVVKIMAAQAMTLGNLSQRKARPGPRERQKLREEKVRSEPEETSTGDCVATPLGNALPESCCGAPAASESPRPAPESLADRICPVAPAREEAPKGTAVGCHLLLQDQPSPGSSSRVGHWTYRCLAFVAWLVYLQSGIVHPEFSSDVFILEEPDDVASAQGFRDLGHLRLSMSDCAGAEKMFARAQELANRSMSSDDVRSLKLERGFALVCSQSYQDGAELLSQVLVEGGLLASSPAYLANALGYAYFRLRDFHKAKEVLETVVQTNPQNPLLWNNLGAASISLGDVTTADDALYYAFSQTSKLGSSSEYYTQLVSNNIHAFRKRSSGEEGPSPAMELFNCMEKELKSKVSSTSPAEFKKTYEKIGASYTGEPAYSETLLASRQATLAVEREYLLCP